MSVQKSQLTQFDENLQQTDDFKSIVLNKTPLIDVRAPIEFEQGSFQFSQNLPLMDDEERHKVGICYKEHGNQEAVKLGHQFVSSSVRQQRIEAWQQFVCENPKAMLYCFRGGMRSKIAQQWLKDSGTEIVRLKGGYKAFRRYLLDSLENLPELMQQQNTRAVVLAGRTGSGKTQLLQKLDNQIDLEGLAHHRGSAFGRHATPQPTQIGFENDLAMAFIRQLENKPGHIVVEDEGRNIGSVNLPEKLFYALKNDLRVVLETPFEQRVQITLQEYVVEAQAEYENRQQWVDFMTAAFSRIAKRLGGERYQRVLKQFNQAVDMQNSQNELAGHEAWIATLLAEYYDPMYDYQMQKHQRKVNFVGDFQQVKQYIDAL